MTQVIDFKILTEHADGSADYELTLSEKDKNAIVRWAVIKLLEQAIEEGQKLDPGQNNLENAGC